MEYVPYADEGVERDSRRPKFERMLSSLAGDGPQGVVVADLSRLFRSRRDRERVDALIHEGRLDVASVREQISTADPDGMSRYTRFADLLMLAYEGEWPALAAGSSRGDVADAFVDDVLAVWLGAWGATKEQLRGPLQDVRNRLHALIARWDHPELLGPLMAPYLEVANRHEPFDLPVTSRALALIGVRNSELENLHLAGVIEQSDWRLLTQAAAHALNRIARAPVEERVVSVDPFADLLEDYPTAAAAFAVLASMAPGQERSWTPPAVSPPPLPESDICVPLTSDGREVRDAMEERLSLRMTQIIEQRAADRGFFGLPSLKHISRNPRVLFGVVDVLLAHGATVVTANVWLSPDHIRMREDPVDYNSADMSWAGLPDLAPPGKGRVGRNEPCPCGSGRKFKYCCGR
jgi:hypothetical protein